jgi:YVTN family beta-propeller protein
MEVPVKFKCLLALALLSASSMALGKQYLFVENTRSGHITVISIPEHEVAATFMASNHPDDVVQSPDGRTVYVNNQNYGGPEPSEGDNEVLAFDTVSGELLWGTPVGGVPHHMTLSSDGRWLYVPIFNEMYTAVIDTRKKRVTRKIFGALGAHGTRLSADDQRLYIGSMFTDALYVVDVESGEPTKVVEFEDGVRPFAFTKDEKTLYVQLSRLHGFEVVDLESAEVTRRIELSKLPEDAPLMKSWPHTYNHGLELSPDERYLLAAGSATDYVAVYSHPELELIKTIPTGSEPNWIVFTPDGRYAYVTNRASDEISAIDMQRLEEVARIPSTGDYPQRMRVVDVPAESLNIGE